MEHVIDYLYKRNDRLVVPIYGCEREMDFGCMNHVAVARDFGFAYETVGGIDKICPVPFASVEEVNAYPWENVTYEAMRQELDNFRKWKANFKGLLGGGCFGPLTVTSDILGVENCTRLALKKPEILQAILGHITDYMVRLAQEEEALGAESFWVAEPLASLLAPRFFTPLSGRYIKRIFDSIHVPGFLHVCGKTTKHTREMLKTGAEVLSVDWMTDLPLCLAMAPEDVVIMGNINPMLFWEGDEAAIRDAIGKLMEETRDYKNFIASSGCQIPGTSAPEKVQLFFDVVKEYPVRTNEEFRLIRRLAEKAGRTDRDAFCTACRDEGIPDDLAEAALAMAKAQIDAGKA